MSMALPSDDVLLGWLDNQPELLDAHLLAHPEDYDRLDRLTELSASIRAKLDGALVVPDELAIRVRAAILGNSPRREAGKLLFEALKSPWQVASLIWNDEELT
jgi:hypothetical protein